jgi:hypothetical protein
MCLFYIRQCLRAGHVEAVFRYTSCTTKSRPQLINLDNLASELRILTKDNDTIYHEAIPMPDALPAIARAPMVKEVPPTLEIGMAMVDKKCELLPGGWYGHGKKKCASHPRDWYGYGR